MPVVKSTTRIHHLILLFILLLILISSVFLRNFPSYDADIKGACGAFRCIPTNVYGVDEFPENIPIVEIRKDYHSGRPVRRGTLELLGGVSSYTMDMKNGKWNESSDKVSLQKFQRILQCAPSEPELEGRRGVYGFMKLVRVSLQSILSACAYLEVGCLEWHDCKRKSNMLLSGKMMPSKRFDMNIRLVRISRGKLYYDWPWHIDRFKRGTDWSISRLIGGVLEKVHDIGDSVFFVRSWDLALFPAHFPVPAFSHGTTTENSDMPYPWSLVIDDEILFHMDQVVRGKTVFSDMRPDNNTVWDNRVEKAIFLGALFGYRPAAISRQIVMDLAVLRPDLVEARFDAAFEVYAYGPHSDEDASLSTMLEALNTSRTIEKFDGTRPGSMRHFAHLFSTHRLPLDEYMRSYKYLLVLAGSGSSGRLCTFLAHSGAVVLLQETSYLYHFTQRLRPWVHYVPVSFTLSDLYEKVEWLRAHDVQARQIARNGRAFGLSYLRLEDYYCYVAAVLKAFSDVADKDALQPFDQRSFLVTDGPKKGTSLPEE